jgi:uncharacterized membrane protein
MGARDPEPAQPRRPAADAEEDGPGSHWDDPDRAVAFSDAVFAIVITLLVLALIPAADVPGRMLADLLAQWPVYLAYLAAYLTVGVVWTNHRAVFDHIRRMDWTLYWLNLGVLFGAVLLPFPTAMVARAIGEGNRADEQTAVGLYAAISTVVLLTWVLFFHYLSRHPELLAHADDPAFFVDYRLRTAAGGILYVGAGLLGALVAPTLALVIFVVAPIFYALTSDGRRGWPGSARAGGRTRSDGRRRRRRLAERRDRRG